MASNLFPVFECEPLVDLFRWAYSSMEVVTVPRILLTGAVIFFVRRVYSQYVEYQVSSHTKNMFKMLLLTKFVVGQVIWNCPWISSAAEIN